MIEIIPAIDLIDGRCVRLTQGDYERKTIYSDSPLEVARQFEAAGIRRVHLVDLDGARSGAISNLSVLEMLAAATKLQIDFGGGIKTENDVSAVLNAGAAMATVGSIVVKDPVRFRSWIRRFGAEKFLVGADVRHEKIVVSGWAEETNISVIDLIRQVTEAGIQQAFCTDVSRDGLLEGPSLLLYKKIIRAFPSLQLTASGGVSSMADVIALDNAGCKSVIIGKAIYENRISLAQISEYISNLFSSNQFTC